MTPRHQNGFALPTILVLLSLLGLMLAMTYRQLQLQSRLQRAELLYLQWGYQAQTIVAQAAQQFNHPQAPLRWSSRPAFDLWRQSRAVCASGVCAPLEVTPSLRPEYQRTPPITVTPQADYWIEVWPLALENANAPPAFIYRVTAVVRSPTGTSQRQIQALWRSDQAKWVAWQDRP